MMKTPQITVFGASGFIGRHLIRRLAASGAVIRVPTRNPEKALILKPMGDVAQVVPFYCSPRLDVEVASAVAGSDIVVNLLGILFEKGRDTFQAVHVEAAARIARLAKEAGAARLIHVSALGADGSSGAAYARSKAMGEQAVRTFFPGATIFRPGIVFGPEDNFFNLFASLARWSPVLPLVGGGQTKFQPVYVGDVADAIDAALKKPESGGKVYELGGPQVYSFRDLLELIMNITGRRRHLINLPWDVAKLQAAFLQFMPKPLLTPDQVKLLKADNIIRDPHALTLASLGLAPTAPEVILPTYLSRFRKVRHLSPVPTGTAGG